MFLEQPRPGPYERDKGGINFPRSRMTAGATKNLNNVASTFFFVTSTFISAVHLFQKDLRFEHGAPNLLLALGAI